MVAVELLLMNAFVFKLADEVHAHIALIEREEGAGGHCYAEGLVCEVCGAGAGPDIIVNAAEAMKRDRHDRF